MIFLYDYSDPYFLTIYTIEMLIKVTAQGLFRYKNSYLRDGWNWLDFIVVKSKIQEKHMGELEHFSNTTFLFDYRSLQA